MVDDELLTKIVAEHGLWAYRLLRTVETGISAVPPDAVAADDRCVLGMWLNGDARTVLDADIRADIVNRHRDLHRVAARLLTLALEGQRDEAVAALAPGGELSRAATGLVATIESWRPDDDTASAADRLTTDAVREELLGNVGMVRAHAEIATSAIREVAGDVGALADGVGEGLSSISEMADRAETTSREVVESRERTGASQKLLGGLQESVGRIGHVLALIDKIAKDTHLLALNANVEAARAGEAGRGFGVVANEVKQLAHDVARATREIKGIIEAVQRDATAILGEIDQFVGSIGRVADNQTLIVRAIEHQRSITQRMADRLTTTAASIGVVEESASSAAFGARGAAVVAVSLVDRLSSAASGERPVRRYQLRGGGEWFLTPDAAHLLNCVGNGEHVVFYAVADGAAVGELRPDYGTAPCGGGIFCNPAGRLTLISWDPTGQFHVRYVGSGALQVSLQEAGPPVTVAVNEEHWRLICETGRTAQVGRSRQEVATVWDLNTGLVIEEVSGDNLPRYHSGYSAHSAADALVAEAVSPDGGLCVATVQETAGAALVLYKAGSGDEVFRAAEASAEKARAAFSADGALLLTHWQAGNDGWVDVWELPGAVRGTGERPSDARRRRSPSYFDLKK